MELGWNCIFGSCRSILRTSPNSFLNMLSCGWVVWRCEDGELIELEMWRSAGDVGSGSLVPKESREILIHDYDVE